MLPSTVGFTADPLALDTLLNFPIESKLFFYSLLPVSLSIGMHLADIGLVIDKRSSLFWFGVGDEEENKVLRRFVPAEEEKSYLNIRYRVRG